MDDDNEHDVRTGGRLDRTTMRALGRRAVTHPLVDGWRFEPDDLSPRLLRIALDADAYPDAVEAARIDVHWFVTDEYYIHYLETRGDSRYQCRWDRHPKTNAPMTHFHPPPDAGDPEPTSPGDHHLAVLFTVLDWVSDRVKTLYDSDR